MYSLRTLRLTLQPRAHTATRLRWDWRIKQFLSIVRRKRGRLGLSAPGPRTLGGTPLAPSSPATNRNVGVLRSVALGAYNRPLLRSLRGYIDLAQGRNESIAGGARLQGMSGNVDGNQCYTTRW